MSLGDGLRHEILSPEAGCVTGAGAGPVLRLRLEPEELICLRLRPGAASQVAPRPATRARRTITLDRGWTLALDGSPRPILVDRGWERQGAAAVSGVGTYETGFTLKAPADVVLELPGLACAARVRLDGRVRGSTAHPPYRVALGRLAAGPHRLAVEVANTAANRYYAGTPYAGPGWPDASGLTRPPRLVLLGPETEEQRP